MTDRLEFSSGPVPSDPEQCSTETRLQTHLEGTGDLQLDSDHPVDDLHRVLKRHKTSMKNKLDLSNNGLLVSGVELLSDGLKSSHCKLETLRLALCNLMGKSCENLGSALKSENCSLKELDLSNNDLQDLGVELLSAGLQSSHCKLEILRLSGCMVTDEGCCSLASALKSNASHLRELDLTYNHPGESAVKMLSDLLKDPHSRLEKLQVDHGGKIRIKPGLKKYVCDLTLDPNTAHTRLSLSERNRKVENAGKDQPRNDQTTFRGITAVINLDTARRSRREGFGAQRYGQRNVSNSAVPPPVTRSPTHGSFRPAQHTLLLRTTFPRRPRCSM
ncbi:hypothetical protein MHYP_G00047960 [Metynnis hypsauchen]